MKRFFVILGIIILCMSTISFAKLSDVKNYSNEIEYLISKGVINGYGDSTFRPENKIARAELVKMIVIATEIKSYKENSFTDVPDNHWAKNYINIAVANELIKGDPAGTFRPDDNITYGEVSTILVRAMDKESEAEKIELNWPYNFMKEAEKLNLFEGYAANDLIAENHARRDNVALMIYNMLNETGKIEKEEEKKNDEKVDTKTAFAGIVEEVITRNAEPYVTIIDEADQKVSLVVNEKYGVPSKKSFIIYQLMSDRKLKLKKELKNTELDTGFEEVERVEGEIIKLKDKEKFLDLDLNEYTLGGKTYKLNKINFFIIELDAEENEFTGYELQKKEGLELKEKDKIKFDGTLNVCYVIREME